MTDESALLSEVSQQLARLWASRWAPLQTDYAGPIPYASP
jgi:hypothetical protein